MISKQEAQKHNLNIVDTEKTMTDAKKDLIEQVKSLLPNIVNSDNQVDVKALKDLFDITNTTSNNQGYELTFAGKGLARAKADEDTAKELKVEEKQSKKFDDTGNVIIRGDNIEALKILYKNYHNKIKMIYIDPPYNTKSENFIYNDNFKQSEEKLIEEFGLNEDTSNFLESVYGTRSHSGWLSFMYPRLQLAKELLSDDGVIFISIDDNEQANLKIICDEIFGEENFIAVFCWEKKKKPSFLNKNLGSKFEYIIAYAKKREQTKAFSVSLTEVGKKYPFNNAGNQKSTLIFPANSVKFNIADKIIHPQDMSEGNIHTELLTELKIQNGTNANEFSLEGEWRYSQSTLDEIVANNESITISKIPFRPNHVKEGGDVKKIHNLLTIKHFGVPTNEDAEKEQVSLLGESFFEYAKPSGLVKLLIKALMYDDKSGVVLDFFAGTGTTSHAAMQLNAEDGGNRKFILCQLDEAIDPKKKESKTAYEFCQKNKFEPVISSITIERVNRAGDKIQKENPKKNVDIGYKVFSLTDRPKVNYDDKQKSFKIENKRQKAIDTLINMLVATCKTLDVQIEELKTGSIYKADNEIYIIDKVTSSELEPFKDLKVNIDSMADIDLEDYLNLDISNQDNITIVY